MNYINKILFYKLCSSQQCHRWLALIFFVFEMSCSGLASIDYKAKVFNLKCIRNERWFYEIDGRSLILRMKKNSHLGGFFFVEFYIPFEEPLKQIKVISNMLI